MEPRTAPRRLAKTRHLYRSLLTPSRLSTAGHRANRSPPDRPRIRLLLHRPHFALSRLHRHRASRKRSHLHQRRHTGQQLPRSLASKSAMPSVTAEPPSHAPPLNATTSLATASATSPSPQPRRRHRATMPTSLRKPRACLSPPSSQPTPRVADTPPNATSTTAARLAAATNVWPVASRGRPVVSTRCAVARRRR